MYLFVINLLLIISHSGNLTRTHMHPHPSSHHRSVILMYYYITHTQLNVGKTIQRIGSLLLHDTRCAFLASSLVPRSTYCSGRSATSDSGEDIDMRKRPRGQRITAPQAEPPSGEQYDRNDSEIDGGSYRDRDGPRDGARYGSRDGARYGARDDRGGDRDGARYGSRNDRGGDRDNGGGDRDGQWRGEDLQERRYIEDFTPKHGYRNDRYSEDIGQDRGQDRGLNRGGYRDRGHDRYRGGNRDTGGDRDRGGDRYGDSKYRGGKQYNNYKPEQSGDTYNSKYNTPNDRSYNPYNKSNTYNNYKYNHGLSGEGKSKNFNKLVFSSVSRYYVFL